MLRLASAKPANVLRGHDSLARAGSETVEHSIARLGDDEFSVLLTDVQRPDDAATVAQRLAGSLIEPVTITATRFSSAAASAWPCTPQTAPTSTPCR